MVSGLPPAATLAVGSQCSQMPKMVSKMMPLTNSGTAISERPVMEIMRSVRRSWRSAASVPNAIESGTITISAATASTNELNRRSGISVAIGYLEAGRVAPAAR